MELSLEQQQALNAFKAGDNIFLTGPGGTGKTSLIKNFVEICKLNGKKVQVCALTGCAAVLLNCQAKTVHSWAGIGLANGPSILTVRKVVDNKFKKKAWNNVDVLIIDEVSMMSQKIFEILDSIAKHIKFNAKPFGGLQIVFSGDFYQLPPVNVVRDEDMSAFDQSASAFCFESPLWKQTFTSVIQLTKIYRQTDQVYMSILNQIRVGKLYKSSLDILLPHIGKPLPDTFVPTKLLPRRRDAEMINASELAKLETEEKVFKLSRVVDLPTDAKAKPTDASTKAKPTDANTKLPAINLNSEQCEIEYNFLVNSIMADKDIILKKGAQVMCIANIDMESQEPIVNGSQGIVIDFVGGLPLVKFNNGARRIIGFHVWNSETQPLIGVKQIPLIYAWAITIHKAQGVSLDMAQIDAGSNIFEFGQTYVALSRIKSLEGLYLTAFDPQKIKVNKKVQEYYKNLS